MVTTKEIPNNTMNQATICLFYARWCSHSKALFPEWQQFRFCCEGKKINGYTIKFASHDFTDPSFNPELDTPRATTSLWHGDHLQHPGPVVEYWMKQFRVQGFPTVRLIKDMHEIDYNLDADMTAKTLKEFVDGELTRITYK